MLTLVSQVGCRLFYGDAFKMVNNRHLVSNALNKRFTAAFNRVGLDEFLLEYSHVLQQRE